MFSVNGEAYDCSTNWYDESAYPAWRMTVRTSPTDASTLGAIAATRAGHWLARVAAQAARTGWPRPDAVTHGAGELRVVVRADLQHDHLHVVVPGDRTQPVGLGRLVYCVVPLIRTSEVAAPEQARLIRLWIPAIVVCWISARVERWQKSPPARWCRLVRAGALTGDRRVTEGDDGGGGAGRRRGWEAEPATAAAGREQRHRRPARPSGGRSEKEQRPRCHLPSGEGIFSLASRYR